MNSCNKIINNVVAWLSGSALVSFNVVTLCLAQLVLGWVTVFGRVHHLQVSSQPPRLTQPSTFHLTVK